MRISYTDYTSTQIYHSDSQYRSRAGWINRSIELRDRLGKKPEQRNRGTLELMDSYYNFGRQDNEEQEVELIIEE